MLAEKSSCISMHNMHGFLGDIGLALFVAAIVGFAAFRLRQPFIVAYMLAGIIVGPEIGPQLLNDPGNIDLISEIGLILLLFVIGLEIDLRKLIRSGKLLIISGLGQFPLSVALGLPFFLFFTSWEKTSLPFFYLATLCSISSTAIVVKSLYDKYQLDSLHGRLSLGILIFQDLYAILFIGIQPSFGNFQPSVIFFTLAGGIALLVFGFGASRYVLRPVFGKLERNPEMVVVIALGWAALMAGIADRFGLSMEMGALTAGLSISYFPYSIHVTSRLLPLRDIFLMLFFISLGLKIPYPDQNTISLVPLIIIFVLISRLIIILPLAYIGKASLRTSIMTSLNLSQLSEFSLVIAGIGLRLGHINQSLVSSLLYAMVITSILSAYTIKYNETLYRFLNRIAIKLFGRHPIFARKSEIGDNLTYESSGSQIFILGYHRGIQALVENLSKFHPEILSRLTIIDVNTEALRELQHRNIRGFYGDLSDPGMLEHAGISKAKMIISTIPDQLLKGTTNLHLVRTCRHLAPTAVIVATAEFQKYSSELISAGADSVLMPNHYMGELLSKILKRMYSKLEMAPSQD